jgi:hypothetical protein
MAMPAKDQTPFFMVCVAFFHADIKTLSSKAQANNLLVLNDEAGLESSDLRAI